MVLQRLCRGRVSLPRRLGWLVTFLFVSFAWVFFRADTPGQALALLGDLFTGGVSLPSQEFVAALPLNAVSTVLTALQNLLAPGGRALTYGVPLLLFPAGLALLLAPNPVRQGETFRPEPGKALLTVLCLTLSLLFLSGVDTFIYANF